MSTEVSIFKQQTDLAMGKRSSRLADELSKASSGASVWQGKRIQTNTNGSFKRLVNGEQIGDAVAGEINVIIIWTLPTVSRQFYAEEYDPDKEPTLPNCWSNLGDKPEEEASDPQHSNCADCPQNIQGSGEGNRRACRFNRRISLLVEGDPSGDLYQFNIPAKSLFGKGVGNVHPFESYLSFLRANGEAPDQVVTNISYNSNADSMELLFTPVRNISEAEWKQVELAQQHPDATRYTRLTVAQADNVSKLPSPQEAQEEGPEEEVAEVQTASTAEEPIAEPVKRVTKKEEPPLKDDIADVLSAWADE